MKLKSLAGALGLSLVMWAGTCAISLAQKEAAHPQQGTPPSPAPATGASAPTAAPAVADQKQAEAPAAAEAQPPRARRARLEKNAAKTAAAPLIRLIELSGNYVDLTQPLGLDPSSLLGGGSLKQKSFFRLCDLLDSLGEEANVSHIVFDLSDADLAINPAQLDELSRHLEKLKLAGKHTIAWLENPGNVHLAVAAACKEIVLADFGSVDMPSSSMKSMFYRDAMDLVGLQASVVRAGNFKGAVEPYVNPQMSEHLRAHYLDMLTAINDAQVDRLARGRSLTAAQVRDLQKQRMLLPSEALSRGLVDKLAPYGSMRSTIEEMIGKKLEWTKPKAAPQREMSLFELMSLLMSGEKEATSKLKDDTIAVLHLSGTIVDGKKESAGSIVSGPTVKAIDELATNDKVKAVVVRVNSPGGSATASEAIRRALAAMAEKKPTIISMGQMAASGGYWVSCIGQPVYAEKGTITGSIGVFSLKISLGSLLRRVGIHVEAIALDDAAKSDSIDRSWSEQDMKVMQSFIDDVYGRFLELVSQSRGLSIESLQELAGGRVWSGTQAKALKLVDELGGLDDCLAAVAKRAKLEKFEVIHRPVVKSGFNLLELLGEDESQAVQVRSELASSVLKTLAQQGFDLRATWALIEDGLKPRSQATRAWALMPGELLVK